MSTSVLDSRDTYARLDPDGLYGRIAGLPEQIVEAWAAARAFALPGAYRSAERIIVLGMGGSGIGGSLLRGLAAETGAKTPVDVVRGYTLPAFVDGRALVLASSNSGNTEEVVSSLGQAIDAGAKCVAITTGGRLLELARARGVPALTFAWAGEPRSALGWSFASLLAIGGGLGLLPDMEAELAQALDGMRALVGSAGREAPEGSNAAKQAAGRLAGRLPVVIGAEALAPVAYRWRTQINENAKSWAVADELPELNHNAPLGYGHPAELLPLLRVVLLRHAAMHRRVALRVDATVEQMRSMGIDVDVLDVPGATVLAQMLWAIQFGDLTSYYMGLLHGVNPSSMEALDWLKRRMASQA
jgi:glucose/mannose-6-phosphate isomerase